VSDKDGREQVARLERLNETLSDSLRRCRELLDGYEARFAGNSNGAENPKTGEETRAA